MEWRIMFFALFGGVVVVFRFWVIPALIRNKERHRRNQGQNRLDE